MQGFVGFSIPIWVRRLVTMIPAFRGRYGRQCHQSPRHQPGRSQHRAAAADDSLAHFHATQRHHGGPFVNGPVTNVAAVVGTAVVLLLNVILIVQTFGIPIAGLPAAD
jgi:manganese transport protein